MWPSARERTGCRFSSGRSTSDASSSWSAARPAAGIAAGFLAVLLTGAGCGLVSFTRVTFNNPITPTDVAFIVPGATTWPEVVGKLGAPDELIGLDQGVVAVYHFRDAKHVRFNPAWPLLFVLPVQPDMVSGRGGLGTDTFHVVFDARWVARESAFSRHASAASFSPWPF